MKDGRVRILHEHLVIADIANMILCFLKVGIVHGWGVQKLRHRIHSLCYPEAGIMHGRPLCMLDVYNNPSSISLEVLFGRTPYLRVKRSFWEIFCLEVYFNLLVPCTCTVILLNTKYWSNQSDYLSSEIIHSWYGW